MNVKVTFTLTSKQVAAVAGGLTSFINYLEVSRVHFPSVDVEGILSALQEMRRQMKEQTNVVDFKKKDK